MSLIETVQQLKAAGWKCVRCNCSTTGFNCRNKEAFKGVTLKVTLKFYKVKKFGSSISEGRLENYQTGIDAAKPKS